MPVSVGGNQTTLPTQVQPAQVHKSARERRSEVAATAAAVALTAGPVVNVIDAVRIVKKFPEAYRAQGFDATLGRLGRLPTAMALAATQKPWLPIIDPKAPAIASAASLGRSFTKWDSRLMKTSVLIATSLAAVQLVAGGINVADALSQEGGAQENLVGTKSGRAGMAMVGGGLFGAGLFAAAMRQTAGQATGFGRVFAAAKAPLLASPIVGVAAIGVGSLIGLNEFGYLDMFNKGEARSTAHVLSDVAQGTPVLNDPTLRTAALAGGAAVLGGVTARTLVKGGVSALKGGPFAIAAGGAAAIGLLGAQLLGGLKSLDKPA